MNLQEVEEIIACLPTGRTFFPYFQGRYALLLLTWMFDETSTIHEVKQSPYAGLLQKPTVKESLSAHGNGKLCKESLGLAWQEPHEQFLLTLGSWGGHSLEWQQTSRPGHNLVLQMNLHEGYRTPLAAMLPEHYRWIFSSVGHPIQEENEGDFYRQTLGWIRLDLDLDTGEALVEEIQSDWLRDLSHLKEIIHNQPEYVGLKYYIDYVNYRLGKIWQEALLSAALWFLKEELGINNIWYHTFRTGNQLKRIKGSPPPRSLYSKLPRKFCFTETSDLPEFLMQDKHFRRVIKRIDSPRWFQMQL